MSRLRSRGLLTASRPKRSTLRDSVAAILGADDTGDDGFGFVRELKADARAQAKRHGHSLGRFHERSYTRTVFNANCEKCQALVCVNVAPRGSEPHIYGPAIKEMCP